MDHRKANCIVHCDQGINLPRKDGNDVETLRVACRVRLRHSDF